ncbi:hypothetical protein ACFL2P_03755 [Candidatus Moduliflexota bacterium]
MKGPKFTIFVDHRTQRLAVDIHVVIVSVRTPCYCHVHPVPCADFPTEREDVPPPPGFAAEFLDEPIPVNEEGGVSLVPVFEEVVVPEDDDTQDGPVVLVEQLDDPLLDDTGDEYRPLPLEEKLDGALVTQGSSVEVVFKKLRVLVHVVLDGRLPPLARLS